MSNGVLLFRWNDNKNIARISNIVDGSSLIGSYIKFEAKNAIKIDFVSICRKISARTSASFVVK